MSHPNDVPGVPMLMPPWLENMQVKYLNPALGPILRHLPSFGVITHVGRKSGTRYETVVSPLRKDNVVAIGLIHQAVPPTGVLGQQLTADPNQAPAFGQGGFLGAGRESAGRLQLRCQEQSLESFELVGRRLSLKGHLRCADGRLSAYELSFEPRQGGRAGVVGHRQHRGVVIHQQLGHVAQAIGHRGKHAALEGEVGLLGHVGHLRPRLPPQPAIVQRRLPGQGLEQAGLAAAVTPDQCHPLAEVELEGGLVEQGDVAKGEAGIIEGDQRHGEELQTERPRF